MNQYWSEKKIENLLANLQAYSSAYFCFLGAFTEEKVEKVVVGTLYSLRKQPTFRDDTAGYPAK